MALVTGATNKGWLAASVAATQKPKLSIISQLKKNLGGWEPGRPRTTLHASEVTKPDFCPRREAFADIDGVKEYPGGAISTAMRATWDIGSMTAKVLIEQWGKDVVIGNWRCVRCDATATMCYKPKKTCSLGKNKPCLWEYVEVRCTSKETGIGGGIDVLFNVGVPKVLITELKIMAPDQFEKILVPLPEHRLRTNLYMRIMADDPSFIYKDMVNLLEGRVLYTSRGHGKANAQFNGEVLPFKEFEVPRDDQALVQVIARAKQLKVFRDLTVIENEVKSMGPMPSGVCGTPLDKVAQKCKYCTRCFNGKTPAEQPALP